MSEQVRATAEEEWKIQETAEQLHLFNGIERLITVPKTTYFRGELQNVRDKHNALQRENEEKCKRKDDLIQELARKLGRLEQYHAERMNALEQQIKDNTALQQRLDKAEAALPDIGRDPLRFRDEESGKYLERLQNACVLQQSGVPDQTALVWRIDLSRIIGDLTVAEARLKSPNE